VPNPRHAHGRGWLDELVAGNVTSVEQIAAGKNAAWLVNLILVIS
jgi:hypothetical protein